MIRIDYNAAVVSYCLDVTHPAALSVPIAILALADVEERRAGIAAGLAADDLPVDQLSKVLLSNVPQLLAKQWDELKNRPRGQTAEALLEVLRASMRNTLHISKILPSKHLEVGSALEVQPALTKDVLLVLNDELIAATAAIDVANRRLAPRAHVSRPRFDLAVPVMNMWPLSEKAVSASA